MIALVLAALAVSIGVDASDSRGEGILALITSAEWESKLQIPLPIIGEGSDRIIYLLPDNRVLKLANCPWGFSQNKDEARIWSLVRDDPSRRGLFFEVLEADPDGRWLIQERAMGHPTLLQAREFGTLVHTLFASTTWCPSDLRRVNLGVDAHGVVKVLDYGTWIVPGAAPRPPPPLDIP